MLTIPTFAEEICAPNMSIVVSPFAPKNTRPIPAKINARETINIPETIRKNRLFAAFN
jgi:hypothetical protein